MDPISAVSLAGSVLQITDFVIKLAGKGTELHRSVTGALVEHLELEAIALNLTALIGQLSKLASPLVGAGSKVVSTAAEDALRRVVTSCEKDSRDLLDAIKKLKLDGPRRKRTSFQLALKSVWNQEKIDTLYQRMTRCREEISFHLLANLNEKQSSLSSDLRHLEEDARNTYGVVLRGKKQIQQGILKNSQSMQDILYAIERSEITRAEQMSALLANMVQADQTETWERRLLQSLTFPRMRDRRLRIQNAAEGTFEGLLQGTPLAWWLAHQNGVFWLAGKAGSGKSTAMKHIQSHKATDRLLRTWAGESRLAIASFYFWQAGLSMQKSQLGLFQGLLSEILRQCPELMPTILPTRWEAYLHFGAALHPWTLPELEEAFQQLSRFPPEKVAFCFFIDGLDEYEGRPQDLIPVLEGLSCIPKTKMCVSSRPWNVFKDAFRTAPSLLLELQSTSDIRHYIDTQLQRNRHFKQMTMMEPIACRELVEEIVFKASGVFLWVFLVIRSLQEGLCDGDRLSDLQERLRQLPTELEDLFVSILESANERYLPQAARLFRLVMDAPAPISLLTLSYCEEESTDYLTKITNPLSRNEILSRCDSMERRLSSRTQGLLECRRSDRLPDFWKPSRDIDLIDSTPSASHSDVDREVHFLHRTVRDFLQTPGSRVSILADVDQSFESLPAILNAYIARIKGMDHAGRLQATQSQLWKLVDPAMECVKLLDVRNERDVSPLLRALDLAVQDLHSKMMNFSVSSHWSNTRLNHLGQPSTYDPPWTSLLTYAVEMGLVQFVKKELSGKDPIHWDSTGPPLLYFAFRDPKFGFGMDERRVGSGLPDTNMVGLLLQLGANPNRFYRGYTVWQSVSRYSGLYTRAAPLRPPEDAWVTACRLFLEHGADPFLEEESSGSETDVSENAEGV